MEILTLIEKVVKVHVQIIITELLLFITVGKLLKQS